MKAFNKKIKPKHMTKPKWKIAGDGAGLIQRRTKKFVQYLPGFGFFGYIPKYRDRRVLIMQLKRKKDKEVKNANKNNR